NLFLQKDFPGATKGIRCDLDLRVDAFDNYTDVIHFDFLLPTDSYFVRIGLGGGATLNEYGQFADGGERVRNNWQCTEPQAGEWVNVMLDIHADGDAGTAKLAVDQALVLSVPLSPPTDTTAIRLIVGALNVAASTWRAHYDNVACDLQ